MGKTKIYSVGFTVHEAQTLVTEKGQPVDPLVVVRCCGREYRTEIKYAKSNVVSWDESHTWTDLCLTDEEWETAYITFEVQAANAFWRNTLLGLVSVQLRLIQLRKTHQIRKALPLQHPDDTDVHGSLRVTVFACAPGEAPPSPGEEEVLEEEDHNDYDDLRKAVIDTNQVVEREAGSRLYHVYVTAYRVEDLPRSSKGARDPFVTCEFAGCKLKSTQARGCCSHTFNECFRFPVVTPLPEDAILIKIWDWNFMKADELIAVGRISFSELRTRQMVPRWFNLYGFDDEEVAQATKVAGQGGRLVANCYLGRILLGARAERLTKEDDLMPAHTVAARPYETPPVIPLAVLADVYEVQGAPGEKVSVEIWCGPARARTKWVTGLETKAAQRAGVAPQAFNRAMEGALGVASYLRGDIPEGEDRFPFDNTEGRVEDLRLVVPEDTKQQWDIIISLYVRGTTKGFMGDTRIAFQRLKRKHVTAVGYQLRAYVYAARNLLSPSGALPNPFVQVACAGTSRETEVFEQTSSPVFMDCLLLDITMMVYDRKQKPKYFIGEYSMSLVPLIPWVLDQQSAIEAVSPVNDFTDTVDLKHLGGLLRGFHGNSKNRGTGQIGLEALSAADRETADAHKEKTLAQSRFATYDPDNKTFSDSWLLPSGLPKILVSSYAVPGFRCDVIYTNMFTLNVYIPAKFVLFAEGKRAADKKTKEQYARPSVDSTLEQFLDDVIFPSDSLKKSVMGDIDVTGFVKFFVNLTHHEEPNPHVDSSAAEWASSEDRMRRHLRGEDAYPKLLKIRVYVIRAISLYVGDDRILPNPYLLFNLGDKSDTLRAEAKPNTHNPEFFTVWEKDVMFPDDSQFELQVWSAHEGTSGGLDDIFIGSTCIDLEERWFSKEWQKSMSKNQVPMEYRPLKQMPSGSFKGTVEMWVELMDFQKAGEVPKFDLQSPAATEVEIRVIVWGARNLNFKALGKDFVDAMIRCNLDCTGYRGSQPIAQQTDVHYYSKTGAAIFNWRMVYSRVVMPVSTCVLQIAAYDNRNMGESPFIGEVNLELRRYLERVASTLNSIDVDAELKLINRSRESADVSSFGFVQVSLQFISQSEATSKPVGLGREPPNRDPRLTTPQEGRKWEDVLGSAGLRVDYRPLWYWVRVAAVVFLSIWIFVVAFLYPSLLG